MFVLTQVLTVWVAPYAGHGAALEVPVPELHGIYSEAVPPVIAQFSVPIDPSTITAASIRLHGNLPWPSYTTCGTYNGIVFTLQIPDTAGTWEVEFYVDQRVNFQREYTFVPSGGATWDFLASGDGTISCRGVAGTLPPGCNYAHGGCCPMGEVTYAAILFEYEPQVPVEVTTWGQIKALYE